MQGTEASGGSGKHEVQLTDRGRLRLTGVQKVESFDHAEIVLLTTAGTLRVEGENLHIQGLDLERGVCGVDGTIASLSYHDGKSEPRRNGLLGRLVR